VTPDAEERYETVRQYIALGRQSGYDVTPGYQALDFLKRQIESLESLIEAGMRPKLPDPGKDDIGLFRKESPSTQYVAALDLYPTSGNKRRLVLDTVDAHGGLCDEQGEDLTGMLHQSWSARRNELVRYGWLEDSGRRHVNRSGEEAIIWVLTERAKGERNGHE
jgi:hypothetical protein